MLRSIIGVEPVADGWRAHLNCGHALRSDVQPVETQLDCQACERFEMPAHFRPYKQTPLFTEATVPTGILNNHSTKAGVWARIHVSEGRLLYRVPAFGFERELSAGEIGIVVPEVVHCVQPLGMVNFYVEFYRAE